MNLDLEGKEQSNLLRTFLKGEKMIKNKQFKDDSPKNTVYRIKKIMSKLDLKVEEKLFCDFEYLYSVRLNIKGTNIGVNGKGISSEFARASAYAEFLERLQNHALVRNYLENNFDSSCPYIYYEDEKKLNKNEILKNSTFLNNYKIMENNPFLKGYEEYILHLQKLDYSYFRNKEELLCVPFYNINNKKTEYLPINLVSNIYLSNGMCAGNTNDEAILQGLCEVIERYVQREVIINRLSFPNFSNNELKKHKRFYKILGLATLFWTKLLRTRNYFNYSSYPADFRVFNPLYSTGVR